MKGESGYDKSIDVWSVGCLAGTLVTNQLLFDGERSRHIQEPPGGDEVSEPSAFDLTFLDTSSEWQAASRQCKSFIRGCVALDASQRMTVGQALQHSWIAHPSFAQAMQAEYARAIADWSPRPNATDLIEYVKDSSSKANALAPAYGARLHQEVRSHHFPSQIPVFTSQFKSFGFTARSERQNHTPLSPIKDSVPEVSKDPKGTLDPADTTAVIGTDRLHHSKKRLIDDGMSNMSIQDFAPPQTYPASEITQQPSSEQNSWNIRLTESMYPKEQSRMRHDPFLHKRTRI